MLQKLQEYKWHIIIGVSSIIVLFLIYQTYSTNKKVNMLYRCLNELSCRIDDVADTVSQPRPNRYPQGQSQLQQKSSKQPQSKPQPQKPVKKSATQTLPPQSPETKVMRPQRSQPVVSETIIFSVSPPMQAPPMRSAPTSTIEEIDSESEETSSDVEVEESATKDVDLDKQLEAELQELE